MLSHNDNDDLLHREESFEEMLQARADNFKEIMRVFRETPVEKFTDDITNEFVNRIDGLFHEAINGLSIAEREEKVKILAKYLLDLNLDITQGDIQLLVAVINAQPFNMMTLLGEEKVLVENPFRDAPQFLLQAFEKAKITQQTTNNNMQRDRATKIYAILQEAWKRLANKIERVELKAIEDTAECVSRFQDVSPSPSPLKKYLFRVYESIKNRAVFSPLTPVVIEGIGYQHPEDAENAINNVITLIKTTEREVEESARKQVRFTHKQNREYSHFQTIWHNNRPIHDEMRAILAILNDYTKHNRAYARFFSRHWNRHHVVEVNAIVDRIIVDRINNTTTLADVLGELKTIKLKNATGTLSTIIHFLQQQENERILSLARGDSMQKREVRANRMRSS